MRKFSYGINNYHKTAFIDIEYGSFFIFLLDRVVEFICAAIPDIILPKIKIKLRNEKAIEFNDNNEYTTLEEWYGSINGLFCGRIHNPITNWCWKRLDHRSIKIDYNEAKKAFYDYDKKFWDDHEQEYEILDEEEVINTV